MQNAKCRMQNRRTKQEQRVLAHYALQEGGKALEEGLIISRAMLGFFREFRGVRGLLGCIS